VLTPTSFSSKSARFLELFDLFYSRVANPEPAWLVKYLVNIHTSIDGAANSAIMPSTGGDKYRNQYSTPDRRHYHGGNRFRGLDPQDRGSIKR
jgi:hypothetical protein